MHNPMTGHRAMGIVFIAMVVFATLSRPAQCASPHYSLAIEPRVQMVRSGDPATITLYQKNVGERDEQMMLERAEPEHAEYDCTILIHDQDGMTPDRTDYGKVVDGSNPTKVHLGAQAVFTVKAGETREAYLAVGSMFKLLPSHSYTLSVTMEPGVTEMDARLISNWVTINVIR